MIKNLLRIYNILFDEYGPQHWWPGETQDEIIIGAILTQNTAWSNVEKAISNLKANNLLSLSALEQSEQEIVANLIRPSGYFNQKAERLITVSRKLLNYSPPSNSEQLRNFLLSIRGIGNETADSIMLYAYSYPSFVVDTYTQRIFQRLGWLPEKSTYAYVRAFFMDKLPSEVTLFNEYHALLVRHAKTYCKKQPDCLQCPLKELCNYEMEKEVVS